MAAACDFDAIPRSITSAGTVRFFPRVSGFTKPIVTYAWTFGDAGTSAKPTPIHEYPAVTDPTLYDVSLTVTDSNGDTATKTNTNFIRSDAAANVSAPPNDGTYHQVSVLIFDDTNAMLVNRNPWTATDDPFTGCHLYLLNPKTVDSIDKIGTATFSLLDVGDSSATEKTLMAEKKNIVIILGKTITFSGKIRRITQNTQAGWDTSTRIKLWDLECDSDLSKLAQVNVDNTMLAANVPYGEALYDTPGNLARLILTQTSPARDILGVISCVDAKTEYQINSSSGIEQVGNQYDHLSILQAQTNYDLRSRADFLLYNYTAFNGATIITNSAASWTTSEFVGMYAIFVGRDTPASKTFTVVYTTSTSEILVSTASTFFAVNDRVTLSTTGVLPVGLSATTYYVKTVTADHLTLSATIGGDAITFSTNGTGTHSVVLKAETDGVVTYGKITANDATTITCAAMVGAASAPQSLGYFLIYRGYLIDFAHDLSQPVAIENLDVNKDVFEFSDNDDKRKLSTKIVATGKDLQGKTISVAIAGVHAYDNEDQFFDDCTFISKLSEGYIYKNTYAKRYVACTAQSYKYAAISVRFTAGSANITRGGAASYVALNDIVYFTAGTNNLPVPFNKINPCWVIGLSTDYFTVSSSRGDATGSIIPVTSDTSDTCYLNSRGQFAATCEPGFLVSGTPIFFMGQSALGITDGTVYYVGACNVSANTTYFDIYTTPGDRMTAITVNSNQSSDLTLYRVQDLINPGVDGSITPYVWLIGWDYTIPTGTSMALVSDGAALAVTTSGTPSEVTMDDGTKCTKVALVAPLTSKIIPALDYGGKGYFLSAILWVDNYSRVWTSGSTPLLIGEEAITITSAANDGTNGNYLVCDPTARIMSNTKKAYPHGVGGLVGNNSTYNEASPQALSPIAVYGLYIDPRTVDNNITYGTLDAYATSLLLGLGHFYKKATTWGPLSLVYIPQVGEYYGGLAQQTLSIPPRTSDRVSFTEYDGADPVEYQIVAVTIDYDRMTVLLELGDFEKNVFTSLQQSTNAMNRTLT